MDELTLNFFDELRENLTLKKGNIEVFIDYMPSGYDNYIILRDNKGEKITSFIDITERQKFYKKFIDKKSLVVEFTLSGEYGFAKFIELPEKEIKTAKTKKKKNEKVSVIQEEVIKQNEEVQVTVEDQKTVISEEEIKHVKKTIEQEIKESIYKNPINLDSIKENENLELKLSEYGINNTQIFTRRTDIDKMIASIGIDYIKNPATTILEPTSGDGAFTTRILELRLEEFKEKTIEEFLLLSLKALSTIYSIEYELASLEVQRNNMYTLMMKYLKNHILTEEDEKYYNTKSDRWQKLVKEIIFYNIIWGATSTELDPDYKLSDRPVLGKYRNNDMPIVIRSWDIKKDLKYKFINIT